MELCEPHWRGNAPEAPPAVAFAIRNAARWTALAGKLARLLAPTQLRGDCSALLPTC